MTELGREVTGATSFIEKLSEAKYFFFIANLFFLADSCLVLFFGRNILNVDFLIHSYISQRPVSTIAIFVVVFLFTNHFLFRIVRHAIISYIVIPIHDFIFIPYIKRDFSRTPGFRKISSVKFEAIRNHDGFTLKRAEQQENIHLKMEQFDGEIFTFVCLLCINVWVVEHKQTQLSVNI